MVVGHGQSMMFRVNAKNRVYWASPKMPSARGWQLSRLRGHARMNRLAFFEVTRESFVDEVSEHV